jgi:hypothetical protein
MFEQLLKFALPHLGGDLKDRLLHQLEAAVKQLAVDQLAKSTAHVLLKSIDSVIAVAVANLSRGDAQKLASAYALEVLRQLDQLSDAVHAYIPMQVTVEVAKQEHGATSPQAAAARKAREAGIAELKQEVKDLLKSATGGDVKD